MQKEEVVEVKVDSAEKEIGEQSTKKKVIEQMERREEAKNELKAK